MPDGALCALCWAEAGFVVGTACCKCGAPLPGDAPGDDTALCDDCLTIRRPWRSGSAVFAYRGVARRLILALKHGDRQDLVPVLARWMADSIRGRPGPDDIVVPVPIHWTRLLHRRFNQSALLALGIAQVCGAQAVPDALIRLRRTKPQEGLTLTERFALQAGTMAPNPRRVQAMRGKSVVLVDDVMTSGATLAAATAAAYDAGASAVAVVIIARVVKD
jgi:predicted amidophosphoribosyltransferase